MKDLRTELIEELREQGLLFKVKREDLNGIVEYIESHEGYTPEEWIRDTQENYPEYFSN